MKVTVLSGDGAGGAQVNFMGKMYPWDSTDGRSVEEAARVWCWAACVASLVGGGLWPVGW